MFLFCFVLFSCSKAGIGEVFEGHQGPVTGINCHMAVGPVDFSHLFVTSSFDWTVKLWTTKVRIPGVKFSGNRSAEDNSCSLGPGVENRRCLPGDLALDFVQIANEPHLSQGSFPGPILFILKYINHTVLKTL